MASRSTKERVIVGWDDIPPISKESGIPSRSTKKAWITCISENSLGEDFHISR
jgi:hypothetical protein